MKIGKKEFLSMEEYVKQGRGCATTRPNHYQIMRNDERIASLRVSRQPSEVVIPIFYTHITDGQVGVINENKRLEQTAVLNDAFNQHRIFFSYDPENVRFEDNSSWYNMDHGSLEEREAKTLLQANPESFLNIYTAGLSGGLLGWATFPWELEGDSIRDGVVILDDAFPGGNTEHFSLGATAVHEIGHWLGLFHTFQGGCDAYGDHIGDTVAHSSPNSGKPDDNERNGACEPDHFAPIHNFMNYVDDDWMNKFTIEQENRMWNHILQYRRTFIS